jgi:hypothetical protein
MSEERGPSDWCFQKIHWVLWTDPDILGYYYEATVLQIPPPPKEPIDAALFAYKKMRVRKETKQDRSIYSTYTVTYPSDVAALLLVVCLVD